MMDLPIYLSPQETKTLVRLLAEIELRLKLSAGAYNRERNAPDQRDLHKEQLELANKARRLNEKLQAQVIEYKSYNLLD